MADGLTEGYLQKLLSVAHEVVAPADPELAKRLQDAAEGKYPRQCGRCHEHTENGLTRHDGLFVCTSCSTAQATGPESCGDPYPTPASIAEIPNAMLGRGGARRVRYTPERCSSRWRKGCT